MISKTLKQILYLILLLLAILSASAESITIQDLINSYSYDYNNGTINLTIFDSYMLDFDSNSVNDTLIFNLTTDIASASTFLAFVDLDNGKNVLTSKANKTLDSSNNNFLINFSSLLFTKDKFNYTIRVYNSEDRLVYRKSNLSTNNLGNYEEGTEVISISDQSISDTYLRITPNINATVASTENITIFLRYNDTTISATKEESLSAGTQNVDVDFDNETIKRTHYSGKFLIDSIQVGSKTIDVNSNTTNSYNYVDFAKTSYIQSIASEMIDNNSNNLSDYLRINFTIDVKADGDYTIKSKLYDSFSNFIKELEKNVSLNTGINVVSIDVLGADIYSSYLDGPYKLSYAELLILNDTQDFIFEPYQTNTTLYQEFERPSLSDLTANLGVTNLTGKDVIQINVTNQGEASAVNLFVDVFGNSTFSKRFTFSNLNVSETRNLEVNNTNSTGGFYVAVIDFNNVVDESNESNNIVQWEPEQVVSLDIESLTTIYSNNTYRIFEFVILNNGDTTVTDIWWQFDAGNGDVINSTMNISSLNSGESAFVYIEYNYTTTGNFDVKVNATGLSESTTTTASLSSTASVGDLLITSFDDLIVQGAMALFEIQAKNVREDNITNINWTFDSDNGEIVKSTQEFNLQPNETILIFIEYDYGVGGTFNPIATVTNGIYSDSETTPVTTNTAPVITAIPDVTFNEDLYNDTLNLSSYVSDAEDSVEDLTWNYESINILVSIDQNTKIANISAPANWSGSENISFEVKDTSNLSDSDIILVTINPVNDPPTFNSSNPIQNLKWPEDTINQSIILTEHFYDIDGDNLNFTASNTENISIYIENITGKVNITPDANWSGIAYVVFTAIDSEGLTVTSNNITLNITPVNDAPEFTGTIPQWKWPEDIVNNSLNLTQYFSDIDGDSLKYNFTFAENITISANNATGIVTLTPNGNFTGVEYTIFTAIDAENLTISSNNVTLNVTPVNDVPVIESFTPTDLTPTVVIGNSLIFNHTSSDIDGDTLIYSWKVDLAEQSTGQGWTYTPASNEVGIHNITLNVSDGTVNVSMQWNVTVINESNIDVYDFSVLNQDSTVVIFGFSINNTGNNATSVNWSLDTGEEIISADFLTNLQPNESIFVFAAYNYSATGDYNVVASATDGTYSDSESITIDIPDIEVNSLSVLNITGTVGTFEFIIENTLQTNLTNGSWVFDTKNINIINSTYTTTLQPSEEIFVYLQYNFSETGTFNVNATAINGSLSDSRNLTVII